jgi:hypothetical protein
MLPAVSEPEAKTPEQLLQDARLRHDDFVQARAAMITNKNVQGALGYCYAKARLRAARAALPKPTLVKQ